MWVKMNCRNTVLGRIADSEGYPSGPGGRLESKGKAELVRVEG